MKRLIFNSTAIVIIVIFVALLGLYYFSPQITFLQKIPDCIEGTDNQVIGQSGCFTAKMFVNSWDKLGGMKAPIVFHGLLGCMISNG